MKFASALAFTALLALTSVRSSSAHEYTLAGIKVVHPWTRATPPGATTAVAYLKLANSGSAPIRLIGGSTPVAQRVEIHSMSMDGGVMRMRPMPGLDIAPGTTLELKAGGLHLMLVGLNRQLMPEEMVPLSLMFADGTKISIELYVEEMGAGAGAHNHS
jgi:copper(I)-binding protein